LKLRIIILFFILVSFGIISVASAEKMWGDKGYGEYIEFTEDYVTPGILMAPSWPDAPINSPGFSQLFNSVADGPFSGIPAMTYSDLGDIKPDIEGQSWEELFLPTPQSPITIGEIDSPSVPISNNEGNDDSSSSIIPSDESLYNELPIYRTQDIFLDSNTKNIAFNNPQFKILTRPAGDYINVEFAPVISQQMAEAIIKQEIINQNIFSFDYQILIERENPLTLHIFMTRLDAEKMIPALQEREGVVLAQLDLYTMSMGR